MKNFFLIKIYNERKTISIEEIGKILESGSYTTSNEDYNIIDYASKHRNL